jgi:hypothetical protein
MPPDEPLFDSPEELVRAYEAGGFKGYLPSERDKQEFLESNPVRSFQAPTSGAGKRALLWGYTLALDPGAYSERQVVGDCVSHGSRNARDLTRAVSLLVNGDPFSWHRRTATEPTYGARGHGGEGMSPARASRFERDVGFCPREAFPGIVDLSKYDGHLGARWGRQGGVPNPVQELCRRNKVGTIANVRTVQDAMSALYNGYGIHSGQMAAWSSRPNSQNIHPRSSPGWAHDMATVGYDDTKEFWPFTVFFVPNSWGRWNTPVPDWPASYPPQPPGMIVTKADDWEVCVRGGDCWVYSDVQGYPPRTLPDLGSIGRI